MARIKKLTVLVGCNYENTGIPELSGCHTDVDNMRTALIGRFGFGPRSIKVLIDKPDNTMPTGANIKRALREMVSKARPGDILYFHFSGHRTTVSEPVEAIIPSGANVITRVDFRDLLGRLPRGAKLTVLCDCYSSGSLIDKEDESVGPDFSEKCEKPHAPSRVLAAAFPLDQRHELWRQLFASEASLLFRRFRDQLPPPLRADQGMFLCGCRWNESCYENIGNGGYGEFTNAVDVSLQQTRFEFVSNYDVAVMARNYLQSEGVYEQHPCLYCSADNIEAGFHGGGVGQ